MPRRSLRPPLKPLNIPLILIKNSRFQQRLEGHIPLEYISDISN